MIVMRKFEAFRSGYASTAVEKMASILGKRLGIKTNVSEFGFDYENKYGSFTGYSVAVGSDKTVQFNFELGKSDRIVSIDIWNSIKAIPDFTVEIDKNTNVIQVLTTVENLLLGNTIEEATRGRKSFASDLFQKWVDSDPSGVKDMLQNERISRLYNDFKDWAEDNNYEMSQSVFIKQAKLWLSQNGLVNRYTQEGRIKVGTPEIAIVDKGEEKAFDNALKMGYREKFEMLEQYIKMIINGYVNSLFVYGTSGSGKSFTVKKILKESNADYAIFSGGVKGTRELVKILYDHREDEILVFDDFDSVMKNKEQVNILKTALQDERDREITYIDLSKRPKKEKIPDRFDFSSGIIILTNQKRVDPAIKSRSMTVDMNLTISEMLNRIKDSIDTFLPKMPMKVKMDVLEFLFENKNILKDVDFRQFKFAVGDRLLRPDNDVWKKWVLVKLSKR